MLRQRLERIGFITFAVLASTFAAYMLSPSHAQQSPGPSAERGQQLAQTLCSTCHLTPGSAREPARTGTPEGIPTLHAIANKPGQTGQHITNILITPHAPMPTISLTMDEIDDLLSYLDTLRSDQAAPPLLSPERQRVRPPASKRS
jgi:mono/diheme cytochrome c family protein